MGHIALSQAAVSWLVCLVNPQSPRNTACKGRFMSPQGVVSHTIFKVALLYLLSLGFGETMPSPGVTHGSRRL